MSRVGREVGLIIGANSNQYIASNVSAVTVLIMLLAVSPTIWTGDIFIIITFILATAILLYFLCPLCIRELETAADYGQREI